MKSGDLRFTPRHVVDQAKQLLGIEAFDLDPAACEEAHHADRYYTIETNGLAQPWEGNVWCNCPYSDIAPWVAKSWEEFNSRASYPNSDADSS